MLRRKEQQVEVEKVNKYCKTLNQKKLGQIKIQMKHRFKLR